MITDERADKHTKEMEEKYGTQIEISVAGTKEYFSTPLNALSVKVLNDEVSFSTVNGKPLPILKALSIRYPHIRFKCRILTDDGNYDYIFENGEVIKED